LQRFSQVRPRVELVKAQAEQGLPCRDPTLAQPLNLASLMGPLPNQPTAAGAAHQVSWSTR